MTDNLKRRESDRLTVPMFIVGCGCILIAGGLASAIILTKASFTTPTVIVIAIFGGGGLLLMPTERVLRAVLLWRKNGNSDSGAAPS